MNIEIDVKQSARDIKAGKSIGGKDGALGSLIKQLTEAALAAEIDSHLTQDLSNNRKNSSIPNPVPETFKPLQHKGMN